MNTTVRTLLAGATLGACLTATPAFAAVDLSLDIPGFVGKGSLFDVAVNVSGLESTDLAAFDIDVSFDDAVIGFAGYALGTELSEPGNPSDDFSWGEYDAGVVNLAELSYLFDFSAQPDAFTLATLTFEALAVGISGLQITFADLSDPDGGVLRAGLPGQVQVVPLPPAMALFAAAAAGLVAFRRRRAA